VEGDFPPGGGTTVREGRKPHLSISESPSGKGVRARAHCQENRLSKILYLSLSLKGIERVRMTLRKTYNKGKIRGDLPHFGSESHDPRLDEALLKNGEIIYAREKS